MNLTRKVIWRSSKLLVFIISNLLPGEGLGLIPGDATITATLPGTDLKGTTRVTVSL